MWKTLSKIGGVTALLVALGGLASVNADEFKKKDSERWKAEYMSVVQEGRKLWTSPELGTNGVSCAQCHPNAANTHPETYPKFQQQLGKVALLSDMVNWCIQHPVEGKPLKVDGKKMVAILSYVTYERRGVELDPGKH